MHMQCTICLFCHSCSPAARAHADSDFQVNLSLWNHRIDNVTRNLKNWIVRFCVWSVLCLLLLSFEIQIRFKYVKRICIRKETDCTTTIEKNGQSIYFICESVLKVPLWKRFGKIPDVQEFTSLWQNKKQKHLLGTLIKQISHSSALAHQIWNAIAFGFFHFIWISHHILCKF